MAPDAESIFTTAANLANVSVPDVTSQIDSGIKLGMGIIEAKQKMEQNKQLIEIRKQQLDDNFQTKFLNYAEKATNKNVVPSARKGWWKMASKVWFDRYGEELPEDTFPVISADPSTLDAFNKEVGDALSMRDLPGRRVAVNKILLKYKNPELLQKLGDLDYSDVQKMVIGGENELAGQQKQILGGQIGITKEQFGAKLKLNTDLIKKARDNGAINELPEEKKKYLDPGAAAAGDDAAISAFSALEDVYTNRAKLFSDSKLKLAQLRGQNLVSVMGSRDLHNKLAIEANKRGWANYDLSKQKFFETTARNASTGDKVVQQIDQGLAQAQSLYQMFNSDDFKSLDKMEIIREINRLTTGANRVAATREARYEMDTLKEWATKKQAWLFGDPGGKVPDAVAKDLVGRFDRIYNGLSKSRDLRIQSNLNRVVGMKDFPQEIGQMVMDNVKYGQDNYVISPVLRKEGKIVEQEGVPVTKAPVSPGSSSSAPKQIPMGNTGNQKTISYTEILKSKTVKDAVGNEKDPEKIKAIAEAAARSKGYTIKY